ncbi:hypothetical protein GCM10027212_28410 [Actinotalea caeni]
MVLASEHGPEQAGELMPIGYGIIAIVVLLALLVVTFAFRNVGTRYRDR